ncbi:MAG: pyridoxamine 5'-phosphate oxidase family protein [Azospirillaceae bacterium]|nr:pyridoxamine 5'-phosphate oxidase family protein [Azospirillaceae bacterium]
MTEGNTDNATGSDGAPRGAPGGASGADAALTGLGVRRLLRRIDRAALATGQRNAEGWPYPSLTLVALDHDASPLLLISRLADHTQNILQDDRVGLLFDGTAGLAEPLSGPRVTVLGRARRSDDPRHRRRFLARHPGSAGYAVFADFAIYRVEIERVHLVGGFGRVRWFDAAQVRCDRSLDGDAGGDAEAGLLTAFAEDCPDGASRLAGGAGDWALIGLDPEGCDLRGNGQVLRLDFETPVGDVETVRAELTRLLRHADRLREEGSPINGTP